MQYITAEMLQVHILYNCFH